MRAKLVATPEAGKKHDGAQAMPGRRVTGLGHGRAADGGRRQDALRSARADRDHGPAIKVMG